MKIIKILLSVFLSVNMSLICSESIIKLVTDKIGRPDEVEVGQKEWQARLASLQKEKDDLDVNQESFNTELKAKTAEIEKKIEAVALELKNDTENDFLIKIQSYLNDWFQIIKEQHKAQETLSASINERITQLTEYLKDYNFDSYRRMLRQARIAKRPFEYLQGLNQKIVDLKKNLDIIASQERDTLQELESKRRLLTGLSETYAKKKDELAGISGTDYTTDLLMLSARQKGELLAIQEKIYKDKVFLEEILVKNLENRRSTISMQGMIDKARLDILKAMLAKEKSSIQVNELDLIVDQDNLKKHKQYIDTVIADLQKEIERIDVNDSKVQAKSQQVGIPLGPDLDEWKLEPSRTISGYVSLFELAHLNSEFLVSKREKDLLEAKRIFEQEQLSLEVLEVEIQDTYYRISKRKFKSEQDITNENKKYINFRDEATSAITKYSNARKYYASLADGQRKTLEALKSKEKELKRLKETLFKDDQSSYMHTNSLLQESEQLVKRQIKLIEETVGVYDSTLPKAEVKRLQLNFIIDELESIKWFRSEYAITLKDIRNVGTDLGNFYKDVYQYITHVKLKAFGHTISSAIGNKTSAWLLFIAILFGLIAIFVFVRFSIMPFARIFLHIGRTYRGLKYISLFFAFFASFYTRYFKVIVPWLIIYVMGQIYVLQDPHIYAIFYLISIPFMIYIAKKFIRYLVLFNIENGYVLLGEDFQKRFALISTVFLYATLSIFLFRESFMMIDNTKSMLPTILLAMNVIILQISLILLLGKDQILHVIPTRTWLGEWIHQHVDTYYNLILLLVVTLIILSNPYVGFGHYIVTILTRIAASVLLIQALLILHDFLKRVSASLFFNIKEETVRERFSYAKTWYGVFVIFALITLLAVAAVIGAKLWHWPETLVKINTLEDIKGWLEKPLLMALSEHPISLFSIFQMLAFILGGLVIAFIFDKFVLHRIFDVLLVEHGVQNAVSSLTRFCIIILAFSFGIQSVGLGGQAWYLIAALMFGVGWVIKDPAYDLISYFMILIQRPVKIGDYIRFDEDIRGVVRRITPRTVILRRRNSATIIIPNSQIMSRTFSNWNYSRGYVAFDDIFITVDYASDPEVVKTLLLEVLTESPYILKSPPPIVRLFRFGAYGFVFQIRGFLSSSYTLDMWDIAAGIRMEIAKILQKNNIQIASARGFDNLSQFIQQASNRPPAEFTEHRNPEE